MRFIEESFRIQMGKDYRLGLQHPETKETVGIESLQEKELMAFAYSLALKWRTIGGAQ